MGQINLVDTMEKTKCTGCKMCGDLCPQKAISFQTDERGFWYPVIDREKCTECGLCIKKCPSLSLDALKDGQAPRIYAAWSKDSTLRHESTSGGMFWEFAKVFIENGGAVAGCCYGDDWKSAKHFLAESMEDLERLRGSKYFQSDTAGIYKAVKECLQTRRKVLFCGTPCQNAALSMYLGEGYSNIYYFDFICRSINSPLAFRKYIEELEEQYSSKVSCVHLKNKKTGWQSLAAQVCFENGEESHKDRTQDWWMKGFLKYDLYTRDSCYECGYRKLPRKTADITVGDFWGITGESAYDMFQGISVVMLNTDKGNKLFEEIKGNLFVKEKTLEDAIPGNRALCTPPPKSPYGEEFFALLKDSSFSEAVKKCSGETDPKPEKHNLISMLRDLKKVKKKYCRKGKISSYSYLYYNYFSKQVERFGSAKLIPYKNAVIELQPKSKIFLYGNTDLEIGADKLKGSKAETYVRLGRGAKWYARHGGRISYLSTLEVHEDAVFDSGYFTMNVRSTIIADKKITFGEDVMLARNVIVYDSDFHQFQDDAGRQKNPPKEVTIENHVWLGADSMVLKGVIIGQDSMVAAKTLVNKDIPERSLVTEAQMTSVARNDVNWKRERPTAGSSKFEGYKLILFGYGVKGKEFARKYGDRIAYIVDNHVKDENVISFKEFTKKHPQLGEEYLWVIASPNYFEEMYRQVEKKYPDAGIVSP